MDSSQGIQPGRNERGQFGKGNPGGPGGSRRRAEFRHAMSKAVTPELMEALIRRASRMALEGNLKAMEFVVTQMAGRPPEAPPEPQVLPLQMPSDLCTEAACGAATEEVVGALVKGKIDQRSATTLIEGIKTRLQSLRDARARNAPEREEEPRPIPNNVLLALFGDFVKTGRLPADTESAEAVIRRLIDGYYLPDPADPNARVQLRDGFAWRYRQPCETMDSLLYEAVHAPSWIRDLARKYLVDFVKEGIDITTDQLTWVDVPEFGTVAMSIFGFEERLAECHLHPQCAHLEQARRMQLRIDRVRRAHAQDDASNAAWLQRVDDAMVLFTLEGELPDDADLLEAVLVVSEVNTFLKHKLGLDVNEQLTLLNVAATSSGQVRADALGRLQAMARTEQQQRCNKPRRPMPTAPGLETADPQHLDEDAAPCNAI